MFKHATSVALYPGAFTINPVLDPVLRSVATHVTMATFAKK
jgi:hypothetical protein